MSSDEELYQQWREAEAARVALDADAPTLTAAVHNVERGQADMIAAWHKRETELTQCADALRAALEQIANRDDAEMAAARTLHYDMRGWARAALETKDAQR
jgi:hypothetical protein